MINDIISAIFGHSAEFIQKLKDQGNIANTGIIINHGDSQVEYRFDIDLGDIQSRTQRFTNLIASFLVKEITIENVIEISGVGIPSNENLNELGIIKFLDGKAVIDFPKVLSDIRSSLVVIRLRKSFPKVLCDMLVYRHIAKVGSVKNDLTQFPVQIVLDYANLWYAQFASFTVRNIIFTINVTIEPEAISAAVPTEIRHKLAKADELALTDKNARKYLSEFQKLIVEFQSPQYIAKLKNTISFEPSHAFKLVNVIPYMKSYNLTRSELPTMLPGRLEIFVETSIEDRQVATNGTINLDMTQFNELLKELLQKLKIQTKNIQFK